MEINLTVMRKMVGVLEGEEEQVDQDVKEAAEILDITFSHNKTSFFSGQQKKGPSTRDSVKEITIHDSAAHLSTAKEQTVMKMEVKLEALESEPSLLDIGDVSSDSTESSDSSDEDDSQETFMKNVTSINRNERRGRPKKERIIEVGQFHCSECKKNFKGPTNLKKHMLIYHKLSIFCDMCAQKFLSVSNYTEHLRESHPSFQCSVCGVYKSTNEKLQNHIEVEHLEDVPCPQCGILFKTRDLLTMHIKRMHSLNAMINCIQCNFKCKTPEEMKSHFTRRHTNDSRDTCQYCGEVFKELKKHLKRTGCGGENGKPDKVQCPSCPKKLSNKPALDQHVKKIHKGVKDRICSQCSYATYSAFNLKLHFSKVHIGQKDLEKESCPHCDKVTTNLKYHIEIKHSETISLKEKSPIAAV